MTRVPVAAVSLSKWTCAAATTLCQEKASKAAHRMSQRAGPPARASASRAVARLPRAGRPSLNLASPRRDPGWSPAAGVVCCNISRINPEPAMIGLLVPANERFVEWLRAKLDFDLATKLDHPVGRQLEELHRALGILHHPGEQFLAPQHHRRAPRRDQGLAAQEETGVHRLEGGAAFADPGEFGGHVNLLHEPIMEDDPPEAVA